MCSYGCRIHLLSRLKNFFPHKHGAVLWTAQAVTLYRNLCLPKQRHAGAGNSFHTLVQLAKFVLLYQHTAQVVHSIQLQPESSLLLSSLFVFSAFYVTYLSYIWYICIYITLIVNSVHAVNMNLKSWV